MRLKLFTGVVLLILVFVLAIHWATKPARTARRFHHLLEQGQIAEVGEMLAEEAQISQGWKSIIFYRQAGKAWSTKSLADYSASTITIAPRSFSDLIAGRCRFQVSSIPFEVGVDGKVKPVF